MIIRITNHVLNTCGVVFAPSPQIIYEDNKDYTTLIHGIQNVKYDEAYFSKNTHEEILVTHVISCDNLADIHESITVTHS